MTDQVGNSNISQQPLLSKTPGVDTSMVQLNIRLSDSALDLTLYNPLENDSLIHRHADLPSIVGDAGAYLHALENFIYDNPLLLNDFMAVNILVESDRFTLMPSEVADEPDVATRLFRKAHPSTADDAAIVEAQLGVSDIMIVFAMDGPVYSFLYRTFPTLKLTHTIVPFVRYACSRIPAGNAVKAYVNFRSDSLDIVIADGRQLRLANRFGATEISDMLYYILATVSSVQPQPEEIFLTGDRQVRTSLTSELRRFHPYVMPMVFPSEMFKAGREAMDIPFDLAVLPLCRDEGNGRPSSPASTVTL